ncbi:hypothetical protein ASPSYDRAFT_149996 [Aspergillus sydowii CBS 593.65]|uniref:Uncharacterized protein n=1 Tax=Aspergillus sydowii CBS 593.65 TaxID=1036612 RepID=A0A1L9TJJ6_9EURO|nr:uncharacterized protein ASPSYDRAFT_149996 [Aspergillus sydowii CBS 593.65]OJJ59551.1 hypothetical protein ASPSYDRAFT_149996 [Aspergillus sydowii CBS 593.65]
MSAKQSMGDAWEDDWESQADKLDAVPTPPQPEKKVSSKVTKAQRRAQQMEFNKKLWAEAESPQTFHFYEASSDVPLKEEFKPTVTVLSRNPQIATRQSSSAAGATAAGIGRLDLNADDSDEEKPPEPTPEERQAMALKNREEKQRKYEEVRERLFGTPSAPTSGASSPRSATPPKAESRGKGRARGNGRDNNNNRARDQSAASGKPKQLYDPGSPSSRPNSSYGRRDWQQSGERSQIDQPQSPRQPVRNPRGPDSSGRGGFKANRGAKAS